MISEKSKGHICHNKTFEFYLRDGEVWRANLGNVLDIDGYRHARWECSEAHFKRYEKIIVGPDAVYPEIGEQDKNNQ